MKQFKAMKVRVKNEKHSKKLQKALFKLGYTWIAGAGVQHTDCPFLYAEPDGSLLVGRVTGPFDTDKAVECFLQPAVIRTTNGGNV
jgi:hypothetical protein